MDSASPNDKLKKSRETSGDAGAGKPLVDGDLLVVVLVAEAGQVPPALAQSLLLLAVLLEGAPLLLEDLPLALVQGLRRKEKHSCP